MGLEAGVLDVIIGYVAGSCRGAGAWSRSVEGAGPVEDVGGALQEGGGLCKNIGGAGPVDNVARVLQEVGGVV